MSGDGKEVVAEVVPPTTTTTRTKDHAKLLEYGLDPKVPTNPTYLRKM